MIKTISVDKFIFKFSSDLKGEHLEFWQAANNTDLIIDKNKHVVSHVLCQIEDDKPFQYLMLQGGKYYGEGVYRYTSIFTPLEMRGKLDFINSIDLWRALAQAVEIAFSNYRCLIVTNSKFDHMMRKINFIKDNEYYYLVDEPRTSKNNWKPLYYRGLISAVCLPKIKTSHYELLFE